LKEQVTRLEAASRAASASGIPFFLNARIDVFLRNPAPRHQELLPEAVERAEAYAAAGASGIFVPGLADEKLIERFCASSPKPVNIMAAPGVPAAVRLGQLGVARVSHGPFPYRNVIAYLEDQARTVYR
jgi:2-methylisocitrate lyase-like PEP mutase family enzyme